MRQLCNSLLHKSPGVTMSGFWIISKIRRARLVRSATVQHGWSRDVLVHQIESGLFRRQGKAVTNFEQALPLPQSDLAQQITKDPYNFDFLLLGPEAHERTSNGVSSITCGNSYWSSAWGSRL